MAKQAPLWLGCDLEETCQIRQLLDLGGHDSIFGRVVIRGRSARERYRQVI
jgi:hypothetical protein